MAFPFILSRFTPDGSIGGYAMRPTDDGEWVSVESVKVLIEKTERQHKLEMDELRGAFLPREYHK